ncbi:MAG: hypothetical protein JST52_06545 [Bacteroidetes bacterium]|nr:hypothetical protein [Bacteroidota bacterium]MBS1739966.1 hypothetical protein [Bacteroidota bacterium]MBS1777612.1 hypothetical protein [Bacteroidota bacterium]
MPCILWVTTPSDSEKLIQTIGLTPYKIIEKDSIVSTREGERKYDATLCGFDVVTENFTDFPTLVEGAIVFLEEHFEQLKKLKLLETNSKLDFGFYTQFVDSKIVAQYDTIPNKLLKLAGELGMDIELSQYWYAENEGAQLN